MNRRSHIIRFMVMYCEYRTYTLLIICFTCLVLPISFLSHLTGVDDEASFDVVRPKFEQYIADILSVKRESVHSNYEKVHRRSTEAKIRVTIKALSKNEERNILKKVSNTADFKKKLNQKFENAGDGITVGSVSEPTRIPKFPG